MSIVKVRSEVLHNLPVVGTYQYWTVYCNKCAKWVGKNYSHHDIALGIATLHARRHVSEILREWAEMADMLTYIALHVGKYQWKVLTTDQKELWADLIDRDRTVQDEHDNYVGTDMAYQPVERWWRD